MESAPKIVRPNGVDICVQTFGAPADPALLLIHGLAASMLWWEEEFCERLAAGPRFVVRYDHRDTGRSVTYEPGAPPYTGRDLQEDAIGVLDALDLRQAHVVGFSAGGGIGHQLALDHPERVATLTLISTSTGGPGLPPPSEEYLAHARNAVAPDWADRAAVIDYLVDEMRVHAARSRPFDERAARDLASRDVDRAINIESSFTNHFKVASGDETPEAPGEVRAPTLVIHGTEDPAFPLAHAHALVKEIPGARLLTVERMGHELPKEVWDVVVPAILAHTSDDRSHSTEG
jgi:pimeloyl-ACP methyl ester carboxylesterase